MLSLFNAFPGNALAVLPDAPSFTVAGATDDFLKLVQRKRNDVEDQPLNEVLAAAHFEKLHPFLNQVLEKKEEMEFELSNSGWQLFVRPVF